MKKRIFGILFVLVALVALCAVSVSAADLEFPTDGSVLKDGWCEHCQDEADWLPLTQAVADGWAKNYDPSAGTHYYVHYTEEGQDKVKVASGSGLAVGSDEQLCLHLNGKRVYRGGARALSTDKNGTLSIMDHAANAGIVEGYAETTSTGCVLRLNGDNAQINLYGGTIEMKTGTSAYAKSGGCVYADGKSTFNMYGGVIKGGISPLGGNVYVTGNATANLQGGTIMGGQASIGDGLGGNIYAAGTVNLGNCSITGGSALASGDDLYFSSTGKLNVKKEFAGEAKVAFDAAHLPDPIQGGYLTGDTCEGPFTGKLYVENDSALPTLYGKDGDTKLYITGNAEDDDEVVTPEGALNLYCQKCKTNKVFLPLTAEVSSAWGTNYSESNGTHYYVAEEKVKLTGGILTIAVGEELCLHLNGNHLYRSGTRAFAVKGTLNLMDHAANEGMVSAYAEGESDGCVVRVYTHATTPAVFNMYGGTLKMNTGSFSRADIGGTVYMESNTTFNMYGGTLADGKARMGGNLYLDTGADFTMTGGTLSGGTAVYTAATTDTKNPGLGGNIYLHGNNIVNISNATITGGKAAERGGNIVTTATNITLNITDSVISDGSCDKSGGNLYLNNGYNTITGCTITGGTAVERGGNIYANAGISNTGNYVKLLDSTVTDGKAGIYGGNIYASGKLTLGNSTVTGGKADDLGNGIYVTSSGVLTVSADFAGEATVYFYSGHMSDPVRGSSVAAKAAVCESPFTGKLLIENDVQLPEAFGKTGDTTLYIKAAAIVKNNGTKVWYDTNADAVAAYSSTDKYLVANDGDLALNGGDYAVDLCGADVNVTGTGSVTLMDTANADFKTFGTATVTGVTLKNKTATEVDGNTYYMVKDGETYSFHRMQAELANVNIRPDSSGIYYDGVWACDDTLKGLVESYGVAVSLSAIPGAGFADENSSSLYTAFGKDTLTSGTTKTGVIIQGILNADKSANGNNLNGRRPIYARAYVKLTDGTLILSEAGAEESMHSAMLRLDQLIKTNNTYSRKYLHDAREFYNTWKEDGMGSWKMNTIPVQPKVEDGVLNLLMMPNSYAYYYVEELYALLMENLPEGITEVNVYNVYHSGCSCETAYNKWKNNEGYYTIFKTCAEGRLQLTDEYTATIEEALALEDWDYIQLHGGLISGTNYHKAEETGAHLKVAAVAEPLLDRFHDLFPHAQLLWQRTWCSEIGRSATWTEEYAKNYDIGMQFISDYMCNEWDLNKPYDLVQVNSGAGWREARELEAGKNLLPFGGLCARLGWEDYALTLGYAKGEKPNSGDGYHDGDIGGAQLINAYTWYETLTGNDCRETVYRPVYTRDGVSHTLPEELVKIFQDAVHGVVSQMPETVKPAK